MSAVSSPAAANCSGRLSTSSYTRNSNGLLSSLAARQQVAEHARTCGAGNHRSNVGQLGFVGDKPLRLVVAALVRHKVAQQMLAQTGDDASPVFGIGGESDFLERVDFVADETGDGLGGSSGWR